MVTRKLKSVVLPDDYNNGIIYGLEIFPDPDDEDTPLDWDEYLKKEEKEERKNHIYDKNMFIDFKKIKKISLKDPLAKTLTFGNAYDLFHMNADEAMLYSDSTWDFVRYSYSKKYGMKFMALFFMITSVSFLKRST